MIYKRLPGDHTKWKEPSEYQKIYLPDEERDN